MAKSLSLELVAHLLSTSQSVVTVNHDYDLNSKTKECSDHPSSSGVTINENKFTLSCPGLSFERKHQDQQSNDHHHHHHKVTERKHAEEHAMALLSRPLEQGTDVSHTADPASMAASAKKLLQNVSHSFAVLVESRLHAYGAFLARHALSLDDRGEGHALLRKKQMEEKLRAILDTGSQVTVQARTSKLEIVPKKEDQGSMTSPSQNRKLLQFSVVLDLTIRSKLTVRENEVISISFSAPGTIQASPQTSGMNHVTIDLNIKTLLANMIQQASSVVTVIVQVAHGLSAGITGTSTDQRKKTTCSSNIPRRPSFLAMPPPSRFSVMPHIKPRTTGGRIPSGLDLLCQAAEDLPIVSPDLSGRPPVPVPALDLLEESDVSDLSPDQCADIVDTCLLGDEFNVEPLRKKFRSE